MIPSRISLLVVLALTLFAAGCSQEARKQKALDSGNKYFEKGQYKQARLMYLNAVKADQRFGEAYYKLALTNIRLGAFGDAVGNLHRAIELQPENLDAHGKLADIYLNAYSANPTKNKSLLNDIRDLAGRMEKRNKDSYESQRLNGFLALADNKPAEALALFLAAEKQKPDDGVLQLTIAKTMLTLKQSEEAVAYLNGAVDKNPSFGAAYDLLYGIAMIQKSPAEAEKIVLRRLKNNPKDPLVRIRLAAHYFVERNLGEMEKVLAETLSRKQDFPNAYQDVGDFYYRIRDYDRAAATYQEGRKQDSGRARMFDKRLIEVRVAQNRADEALALCESILAEDKNDHEAIAMRASLRLYAGKAEHVDSAITELQSVVAKMPENFVLRYNLGRALMTKGDTDGARVQFTDALRRRPDYMPARIALAQVLVVRREYGAAMTAANEILQTDPDNQYARLILSNALLAQGKFADSKVVLQQTLKLNPNQRDAKFQLGMVHFREGKLKEAETEFQQLYAMSPPDLRGLAGLSEVYMAQKQEPRAMQLLDEAMAKYPNTTVLQVNWANMAVRSGKVDDGIAMFRKILERDPRNFDIHMRLGESFRRKGDVGQAIEIWKKAAELRPNVVQPLLFRAVALAQVNRTSEAAPLYEQILRTEPDNLQALNNYSFYLAEQGTNLDLALTYAQKARSKEPTDPMVADTLGYVYLKKNLPENAASIFTELTAKYPKVALFHIRLATAYLQAGEKEKAKRQLDDARKANPTPADQQEIQKLAGRLG
jgi:predicted Zn-dependent protease